MDYYKLLGLEPTCTDGEIQQRYRELAENFASDPENLSLIHEAAGVIGDPVSRRRYDTTRLLVSSHSDQPVDRHVVQYVEPSRNGLVPTSIIATGVIVLTIAMLYTPGRSTNSPSTIPFESSLREHLANRLYADTSWISGVLKTGTDAQNKAKDKSMQGATYDAESAALAKLQADYQEAQTDCLMTTYPTTVDEANKAVELTEADTRVLDADTRALNDILIETASPPQSTAPTVVQVQPGNPNMQPQ